MNHPQIQDQNRLNRVFVYGTMRPDIKAPWSDLIHNNKNFKLNYSKAYVPHAMLQLFKNFKYSNISIDTKWYPSTEVVHGYLIESSDIDETLRLLDEIENYPKLYDRTIVTCFNVEKQKEETAYVYVIPVSSELMRNGFMCIYNDMKQFVEREC